MAIGGTAFKVLSRSFGLMLRQLSSLLTVLVAMISMLSTISPKTTATLLASIAWLSSIRTPSSHTTSHRRLSQEN
jgi:hypothetical protein